MSEDVKVKATIEEIDPEEKAVRYFPPLLITKGIIGLLSGIILLFWPKAGLTVASVVLGVFLLVDGVERLITVLRYPSSRGKSDAVSIIGAILRIVFGVVLLFRPLEAGNFWVSVILIITGINLIAGSLFMFWSEPGMKKDFLSISSAVLMLILGLLMIILPVFTALLMFRILGGILILAAIPSLAVGLRSRK